MLDLWKILAEGGKMSRLSSTDLSEFEIFFSLDFIPLSGYLLIASRLEEQDLVLSL